MTFWSCRKSTRLHIFPKFSKSKGKQAMRFGQLIEYNMRNIFFDRSYRKCARETIPRSLSKNQIQAYFWINSVKLFLLYDNLFKKSKTKTKSGLELVYLPHFLYNFQRRILILGCFINWPNFIDLLPLIREMHSWSALTEAKKTFFWEGEILTLIEGSKFFHPSHTMTCPLFSIARLNS